MLKVNINNASNYQTENLTQWDSDQVLELSGVVFTTTPVVHFANKKSAKALVVEPTLQSGVLTVDIPNSLLRYPHPIVAYVYSYDNDAGTTELSITIPVIPRIQPDDYVFAGDKGFLTLAAINSKVDTLISEAKTSFNALETSKGTALDNLISTKTTELDNLKTSKTQEIDALIVAKTQELDTLKTAKTEEIDALITAKEQELADLLTFVEQEGDTLISSKRDEIDALITSKTSELDALKATKTEEIDALIAAKTEELDAIGEEFVNNNIDFTLTQSGKAADAKATGDALALKAPTGYGYGEVLSSINVEDEAAFDVEIETILSGMKDWETKQFSFIDNSLSTHRWYATIFRWSENTATVTAASAASHGSKVMKIKVDGVWKAWEWENPPLLEGVEYRTTERYLNKPIYTTIVNCGEAANDMAVDITSIGATAIVRYAGMLADATPLPFIQVGLDNAWSAWVTVRLDTIAVYCGESRVGSKVAVRLWYTKE